MAFIKKKMTGNSSENMQKELPLVSVVVSVHRYSHYGNQHGAIARNTYGPPIALVCIHLEDSTL